MGQIQEWVPEWSPGEEDTKPDVWTPPVSSVSKKPLVNWPKLPSGMPRIETTPEDNNPFSGGGPKLEPISPGLSEFANKSFLPSAESRRLATGSKEPDTWLGGAAKGLSDYTYENLVRPAASPLGILTLDAGIGKKNALPREMAPSLYERNAIGGRVGSAPEPFGPRSMANPVAPRNAIGGRMVESIPHSNFEEKLGAVSDPTTVEAPQVTSRMANPAKPRISAKDFAAARDFKAKNAVPEGVNPITGEEIGPVADVPKPQPENPKAANFEPSFDPRKLFPSTEDKLDSIFKRNVLSKDIADIPKDKTTTLHMNFPSANPFEGKDRSFQSLLDRFKRGASDETGAVGDIKGLGSDAPKPKSTNPNSLGNRWQAIVDELDKAGAKDTEYRDIMSTGGKDSLKKGETWRSRVLKYIDQDHARQVEREGLGGEKGSAPMLSDLSQGIYNYGKEEIGKVGEFGAKAKKAVQEEGLINTTGNTMRGSMAAVDLSAPLRQAAPMMNRKEFWKSLKPMVESYMDEGKFAESQAAIKSHPAYELAKKSGLSLTDLSGTKEEQFLSNLAEDIPFLGRGVRASNRAYVGFLNKVRMDTFANLAEEMHGLGMLNGEPTQVLGKTKELARFVNAGTGRGSLGSFEPAAKALNSAFFSPRLAASRLHFLNPATYVTGDPFVRKQAIKSMASFVGAVTTLAGLAKASGLADVNMDDPTNPDFMKLKFGNTRVDFGAGFQQYLVAAAKVKQGYSTSSTSGKVTKFGEGYRAPQTSDVAYNLLKSKEAPLFSFAMAMLDASHGGKGIDGKPISVPKEIADRFIPMIVQDMRDIISDDPKHLGAIIPGILGAGVQTYAPQETSKKLSIRLPKGLKAQ